MWEQGYEYVCGFFSSVLSPARKSQGLSRLLLQLVNDSGLSAHLTLGEPRQEQQKRETVQVAIQITYHVLPKCITEMPQNLQIGY